MKGESATGLAALVAAHLDHCPICSTEPLFAAISRAGVDSVMATMGRAVLIAHLHPEDPHPCAAEGSLALIKSAVAADVAASDNSDLATDTWVISDKDGVELGRVWGDTYDTALHFAKQNPVVRTLSRQGSGYRLRRLRSTELHSDPTEPTPVT